MRKIRVLSIAFNDLGHGGIQSTIMVAAEKLKNDIDEDIIVFSSKPAYYDQEFEKYGRIFRCPNYEGDSWFRKRLDYYIRYFRIKRNVLRIINKYGPYDVVHSHSFFEAAPCMAAAKKAGVPVRIAHSHNTAAPDQHRFPIRQINELYRCIYRYIILRDSTVQVGCSRAAADYLFGQGRGRVIYNCVNYSDFTPEQFSYKNWQELRLIHVGNYLPQKNQLFLVEVFYYLQKYKPDSHLTMIGRPSDYMYKVQEKIHKLGIEEKIDMLPHSSNIPLELSKADYFLFPSSFEGFGNVMLEAQAAGLHCFASTEVTTETNCGLATYLPLNLGAEKWAEAILEFYKQNGTKKKKVDMSRFSEDTFAEAFLKLYRKSMEE